MTQLQFRWNPAERGRDRGQSKNRADLSLQRLSVSLTGSTGYLENRLYTDTLTHAGTLFTLHTAPSDTHPLNGWSLVVTWQTHTNTHITHAHRLTHRHTRPSQQFLCFCWHKMSEGFVFKVQSCFSGCAVPCAMWCMPKRPTVWHLLRQTHTQRSYSAAPECLLLILGSSLETEHRGDTGFTFIALVKWKFHIMISVYEQAIPVIQSMSLRAAVNAPFS